ncbi:hypothetical protein FKM82_001430 [Ascaphus truei]
MSEDEGFAGTMGERGHTIRPPCLQLRRGEESWGCSRLGDSDRDSSSSLSVKREVAGLAGTPIRRVPAPPPGGGERGGWLQLGTPAQKARRTCSRTQRTILTDTHTD